REMMAELGSVLAFSAVRNNDKVGLVLFSDFVELFIPPDKGRSHILRVIREILFFQPQSKGTNIGEALDFVNRVAKRKCVTFLLSDFCLPEDFADSLEAIRPKLQITGRRHDLITVSITDPREQELPDVGRITLEDAETGEQVVLNTADAWTRQAYANLAAERAERFAHTVRSAGIDLLQLSTDKPYLSPLMGFFSSRKRRIAR
ncbi:MAG: VWA domain-containing protein, partial [Candidatus Electrothrix sp. AR3]|nr:VWA domain-containing protein [Candidatus Electrothrix sp. AR3]